MTFVPVRVAGSRGLVCTSIGRSRLGGSGRNYDERRRGLPLFATIPSHPIGFILPLMVSVLSARSYECIISDYLVSPTGPNDIFFHYSLLEFLRLTVAPRLLIAATSELTICGSMPDVWKTNVKAVTDTIPADVQRRRQLPIPRLYHTPSPSNSHHGRSSFGIRPSFSNAYWGRGGPGQSADSLRISGGKCCKQRQSHLWQYKLRDGWEVYFDPVSANEDCSTMLLAIGYPI